MAEEKPKPQEEEGGGEGAPLWIISFADMVSLLMAFFVMLSTFSTYGGGEKAKLKNVGRAIANYVGFGWYPYPFKSAIGPPPPAASEAEQGSERPTLESTSDGKSLAKTGPKDFRSQRVFLIESKKVFVSDRVVLTGEGREFLDSVALFVSKTPARVVIAEVGSGEKDELGTDRTIAVIKYLGGKGVPKERCNMGIKGTLPEKVFKAERMLEITLLEEGVYK